MDKHLAVGIASQLLCKHKLFAWRVGLKPLKNRLGQCEYGPKLIILSEFHVENNPDWMIKDTIFHEVAHALAGWEARHGPIWKATAARLGAIPKACSKPARTPEGRYQAGCPSCKRVYHRHRKPKGLVCCPRCGVPKGLLDFWFASVS
jgi:hypothetical protein